MSHFVVMVTNTDCETLEEQLEPFYEQGSEDDYFMQKEYFLENNVESVNSWLNKEIQDINCIFNNPKVKESARKIWRKNLKELENIKKLKTLRGKINAIHRYYGGGIDEGGLYWLNNPNAKWDWWVEGGRWNGWLVKKNGEKCNRCLVKELDFDGMKKAELEDRAKYYDKEIKKSEPFFWGYKQIPTRDEYVYGVEISVSPYAVLHDGEWIEKGEMGWWGIDDPHYTEEDWEKKFQEFFKTLDPETEIAIVDCHI